MKRRTFISASIASLAGCTTPQLRSESRSKPANSSSKTIDEATPIGSISGTWPTTHRTNARTANTPESPDLQLSWATAVSGSVTQPPSQPLLRKGILIQTQARTLYGLDPKTGEQLWKTNVPESTRIQTPPTTGESTVYVTLDDSVAAYDLHTGEENRKYTIPDNSTPVTAVLEAADDLFVGINQDGEGALARLTENSGTRVFKTAGIPRNLASNRNLIVVRTTSAIQAFSKAQGELVWIYHGVNGSHPGDVPLITNRFVVSGNGGGSVIVLNLSSGQVAWQAEIQGMHAFSPTKSDSRVFVSDSDGYLQVYSIETGNTAYKVKIPAEADIPGISAGNMDRSATLAGDSVLIPSSDGRLVTVKAANGRVKSSQRFRWRVASPPAIVDGVAFVSAPPRVYAFSA
ncbi:PQQ-binding-like beta-propeller repeat protein [Halomicrobium sp. IBSBa]|uniref:outer membrane protein assembly factor BamB family protein n=1 Tax=Halomicrobium sp. IBSBa TaxID=2778916 RepID=UPI001ABF8C90|nr:PQQ-binding-like beta-propeller repeat protein [Halomicrobium sp. IBSBa]MBO4248653.1 PQQ-binding-like beta-propeller repeat protein [Halomicrobium sp. IBSBa]